ncbi:MAG: response regulator [Deltaproteobacteria bacterium]|nr:response regulator [Deltaproteobacteria bacterium]
MKESYFSELEPTLAGVLRVIPDLLFVTDEKGIFLDFNLFTTIPLALPREKIIGSSYKDLGFDRETLKRLDQARESANITGKVQKTEYSLEPVPGKKEYFVVRFVRIKPDRILSIVKDVTEEKQLTEKLNMLGQGITQSLDGVAVVDKNGQIIFSNLSWAKIHNWETSETLNANIGDFHSEKQMNEEVIPFNLKVKEFGSWTGEVGHIKKDGTAFPCLMTTTELKDSSGEVLGLIGIARDITEQKERENELERAKNKAQEASDKKSKFLASLSHEIRTPMNGIIGLSELLLENETSDDKKDYLGMILSSAKSLMNIINDILDVSRIEAGKENLVQVEFDPRQVITETLSTLSVESSRKSINIDHIISSTVSRRIISDPTRLAQIISNISINAVKYSKSGPVKVLVDTEHFNDQDILVINITDHGDGLSPQDLEKIWIPYERLSSSRNTNMTGSGLGLSIAKQLCELLGGSISVESEKNSGTTFTIKIPVKLPSEKQSSGYDSEQTLIKSAMILSKNKTLSDGLNEFLKTMKIHTISTDNPVEAVSLMENFSEQNSPEFVVIDTEIDSSTDYIFSQFLGNLNRYSKNSILFVIRAGNSEIRQVYQSLGYSNFLTAPVIFSHFMRIIKKAGTSKTFTQNALEKLPAFISGCNALVCEDNVVNQKLATVLLEKVGCKVDIASNGIEAVEKVEDKFYDIILMDVEMPTMDGLSATRHIRKYQNTHNYGEPVIIGLTAGAMPGDREKCLEAGMNIYIPKPLKVKDFYNTLISSLNSGNTPKKENKMHIGELLNLANLKERYGDDFELLSELINMFSEDYPDYINAIRTALSVGDFNSVRKNAHTLKGSISNFDATEATSLAFSIEKSASDQNVNELKQKLLRLEDEIRKMINAILLLIDEGWPI